MYKARRYRTALMAKNIIKSRRIDMIIRQEKPEDFSRTYHLVKTLFRTVSEQDFVNRLHSSANYIPELALIAEENGKLIGHILLTITVNLKRFF
jgi:predicted N-acetyltransferase YhbS